MSAVLQSPTLPTLINLEDMKAYIDSEINKAVKPLSEKIDSMEAENASLRLENVRLRRHVSILEGHLNINYDDYEDVCLTGDTYEDLKDEGITPFCDKIKQLSERLEQPLNKSTENIKTELPIIPNTTLEHKAMKLVERLKIKPRSRTGEVFMDNKDIAKFLTTELPEDLRTEDTNLRRVKKRVIEKAKSLFPDSILINKSKYGRHETRIVLKESYLCNRNGTLV
jgi:regulator of replication initiation timing